MNGPKLRVFAGPNGSGKSTVHTTFPYSLGVYVNADDIEREIRRVGSLDLQAFGLHLATDEARSLFRNSSLLQHRGLGALAGAVQVGPAGSVSFPGHEDEPYLAAIAAEVVRDALVEARVPFSFETVMSSADKVRLMDRARAAGFRVYLYYVSTVDPQINVNRVAIRVSQGGHPVPEDKIRDRYTRSLKNLADAVRQSDRAFLFDNSGEKAILSVEAINGRVLAPTPPPVPWWVERYALNPLSQPNPE